jgi:hypothetical protein
MTGLLWALILEVWGLSIEVSSLCEACKYAVRLRWSKKLICGLAVGDILDVRSCEYFRVEFDTDDIFGPPPPIP